MLLKKIAAGKPVAWGAVCSAQLATIGKYFAHTARADYVHHLQCLIESDMPLASLSQILHTYRHSRSTMSITQTPSFIHTDVVAIDANGVVHPA